MITYERYEVDEGLAVDGGAAVTAQTVQVTHVLQVIKGQVNLHIVPNN